MIKVYFVLLLASVLSINLTNGLDICENQFNGTRLAHPADCNKFVICKNGRTESIRNCPIGLHFNRFKRVCDLRDRAACDFEFMQLADKELDCSACCTMCDCNSTPTPEGPVTPSPATPEGPGTPSPETPEGPVTPTPETPESPGTPSPGTPEGPVTPTPETTVNPGINCNNNSTVCVGKKNGSVSYVNGTCNQYIVCNEGCANILSCPNNLQYNPTTNECDYPQNVNCPWESKPPSTGPSGVACAQPGKCLGKKDGTMFSDPNSNGYIQCQCECEIKRPCAIGTQFNEILQTCEHINNGSIENGEGNGNGSCNGNEGEGDNGSGNNGGNGTICSNDITVCQNQTTGTHLPVENVCNKFYVCSNNCAIEVSCPDNLIYNPNQDICDYPQNYKCPWPYKPPSGPNAGPSGIACASGGRCVGKANGTFFPSTENQSKYVICQCECEVELNCPAGLVWDNKLSTCNYPVNNV